VGEMNDFNSDNYSDFFYRQTQNSLIEKFHNWNTRQMLKALIKHTQIIPLKTSVLEIGAGTGRGGKGVLSLGFREYLGVEPSDILAEHCEGLNLPILRESLPRLSSIKTSSWDVLFAFHVIEHAPNYQDAVLWINEMIRVLKPGGILFLIAPDIRSCKEYFWDSDRTHGFPTTPNRVSQLLLNSDAEVIVSTTFQIGSTSALSKALSRLSAMLIPTMLLDSIARRFSGRPLMSGFQMASLWTSTFVIAQKRDVQ
jgi:SAM-dependent methyltransferase